MWEDNSATTKVIFVAVIILITLNAILVVAIIWNTTGGTSTVTSPVPGTYPEISDSTDRGTCTTPACVLVSSILLKSLNQSVDPCYNFYAFACQGFARNAILPNHEAYVSNTFTTSTLMEIKFNELLNEPIANDDPNYFKMMKKYYRACKNKRSIEANAEDNLHEILKKLGGWPILEGDNWNESEFDWMEILSKAKKLGLPFDFFISLEPKFGKLRISSGGLNQSFNDDFYRYFLLKIAEVLGAFIDDETVIKQINDTYRFDKKFNGILVRYPSIIKNVTLKQLENSTFPWLKYLEYLSDIEITPDLEIIYEVANEGENFIQKLDDYFRNSSKRIQANSIIWQIIQRIAPYMNEEIFLKQIKFNVLDGTATELKPRWKECVSSVVEQFNVGSTAIYSKKFFKNDIRPKITDTIRYIINEIKGQAPENTSKFEKLSTALKEVDESQFYIGFPDQVLNDREVEDYYEGLELVGDNYLNLAMNLSIFKRERKYLSFKDSRFDWVEFVPVFEIYFRSEVLMTPVHLYNLMYFQKSIPEYLNFGFLEDLIKPLYKVHESVETKYRKECDHYYRYYPESYVLDGTYLAHHKFAKNLTDGNAKLPGFENFTTSQMFFISYGTSRCIKRRPNFRLKDEAVEHFFNVEIRNSKYFAKMFNCSKGSKMWHDGEEEICVNKFYPF